MDRHRKSPAALITKRELHPRNRHRGEYDFPQLILSEPALAAFVGSNRYGNASIDFANPQAVRTLNRALLRQFYAVNSWDIPAHYLCPPIPGRADYLHYLADLLASENGGIIARGNAVRVLDVGTGANLVYPLIGQHEYGWQFVGVDVDKTALGNAEKVLAANPDLRDAITLRWQSNPARIFAGVVAADEKFDLTLCNPPFHASLEEAQAGTARKLRGLAISAKRQADHTHETRGRQKMEFASDVTPALNFGGQANELYCAGGEAAFIKRMIQDSTEIAQQVLWFTTLVSKSDNLPSIYRALQQANVVTQNTIKMAQGQKQSRFVAWTFHTAEQRAQWRKARWRSHVSAEQR